MYGVVLEGGGAKGAYQIGAIKALKELNVEIGGIAGTSVGALNGAMIVQDDLDEAYKIWFNINPSALFNIKEEHYRELKNFEFNKNNIMYIINRIKHIMNNRGIDISLLKELINEKINESNLRKSKMDFGIVTVSLSDFKSMELFIEDIPTGKVTEYLMASAYLPVFKLEKLDGKLFLDGGLYDNLPINLLINRGYKDIIAIRTLGMGRTRKISSDNAEIKYIIPGEDLGRALDFNKQVARKNLKLGYFDAKRMLMNLKGKKYYILAENNENMFMNLLQNLGKDRIIKAGIKMGLSPKLPYRRMLFEYILPRLHSLMGTKNINTYEDISIYILEVLAEDIGVNRFKIYSYKEFLDEIRSMYSAHGRIKSETNIPDFIKKNELLSKAVKEKIILEIARELFADFLNIFFE